jgi:hypothetical protein
MVPDLPADCDRRPGRCVHGSVVQEVRESLFKKGIIGPDQGEIVPDCDGDRMMGKLFIELTHGGRREI